MQTQCAARTFGQRDAITRRSVRGVHDFLEKVIHNGGASGLLPMQTGKTFKKLEVSIVRTGACSTNSLGARELHQRTKRADSEKFISLVAPLRKARAPVCHRCFQGQLGYSSSGRFGGKATGSGGES